MKKLNVGKNLFILGLISVVLITGCGSKSNNSMVEGKVNVMTTFYPIYEFAQAIGGENANIVNLIPAGIEPHDWTPKSQDILSTSKAQLFLYNGAGLEGWVPDFLKGLNKDSEVKAVEVSQGVDLIESEEDHEHDHGEEGNEEISDPNVEQHHIDPHTWVSPKSALVMAANIKDSFIEVDPENESQYEQRYQELNDKLLALDSKFTTELSNLSKREIVVSHQAFGYLTRDYGLTQHAIMGLSADAEPRAQDIINLANLVQEEGIKYIFFEELVSDRLAKTLAAEADVDTMVLNPVEGLTKEQQQNNENYFTLMEKNLQNLIIALK
ncbi:metal ABC transporter solute-binding protein, Zn/Mn family [Paenibacillus crassostreae]|uniref:ABC transporter substrate-binding protein n=1 Tax=Paenibacillus crassostreae TaxID=1763538 RepID=A0A167DH13_9BACL|nr:zinc ABC transporter substrate-binding protein [Paenibacillus crassostreae]AOZ91482.1 ABC transporter substrate-binding protein [Paenibacillus crassostreae]OAB74359.1 ABC transporter substrate-binding protein [Paenibacillus crassostreae]